MSLVMNISRAVSALLVAALMPGVVAILITSVGASSFLTAAVVFGILYIFSLPFILIIGFFTLFFLLKIKYGPLFMPPLIGCLSGMLIAN